MSEQLSLWDKFGSLPTPTIDPKPVIGFDIAKLKPTWHEGQPYVLDLDLGRALRYARPIEIRKLIRRLAERPSWGPSCHRGKMVRIGSGARRSAEEYLLTEKQVVLVCMRSELPNIDEVQSLIADVFIAWRHGNVRAVDAETEVKLQEATDRAFDAAPDVFNLLQGLATVEDALRAAECAERAEAAAQQAHYSAVRTEKAVANAAAKKRQPPFKHATDCSEYIVWHKYRAACPCCQDNSIMSGPGARIKDQAHWDHWENKVWKRGPYDGWYVCKKCNERFENEDEAFRSDSRPAWDNYLGHVRWYHKLTTKLV